MHEHINIMAPDNDIKYKMMKRKSCIYILYMCIKPYSDWLFPPQCFLPYSTSDPDCASIVQYKQERDEMLEVSDQDKASADRQVSLLYKSLTFFASKIIRLTYFLFNHEHCYYRPHECKLSSLD